MIYLNILLFFWFHPFYVSVTTVDQSRDKSSLEISSRIFYDDLEAALKEESGKNVDLRNPDQVDINSELIKKYFGRHFQIKINNMPVQINYLGFSIEGEAAWCFLELKNTGDISKIEITNSLLYKSFKEQINIFHLNINGSKKSRKLHNPDRSATFTF